jgi:hypothetical protein
MKRVAIDAVRLKHDVIEAKMAQGVGGPVTWCEDRVEVAIKGDVSIANQHV